MPGQSGKTNSKAEAGMAKKAAAQAIKDEAKAAADEKGVSEEWKVGSNVKKAMKDDMAAEKEADKRRKELEKAQLLADDEELMGGVKAGKPKKVKKKDDLGALLLDGLAKAPKSKAEKEAEKKKKLKEAARKQQAADEAAAASKPLDPLKPAPLVPNLNHKASFFDTDEAGGSPGGSPGQAAPEEISASGTIDNVLAALDASGQGGDLAGRDKAPEKSRKAKYEDFEAGMLPQVKADYPGLKLAQYRDKIFKLWERSPENPKNIQGAAS